MRKDQQFLPFKDALVRSTHGPFKLKGVNSVKEWQAWCKGESNDANPVGYNCTFPAVIAAWRAEWYNATHGKTDPLFPFWVCAALCAWRSSVRRG